MSDASIRYESRQGIAELTIAQPARRNAMTLAMWSSLPDLIARAVDDGSVRALVLTGAGDEAFCAGADISEFGANRTGAEAVMAYDRAVAAGTAALVACAKPTVAVIRGVCFGGGFGLAISCDLRFAQEGARFRIPAGRLGLGYGYKGIRTLVQRLGPGATADIMFSARTLAAEEAKRLGVVNEVWPAAAFAERIAAYLATMAANAPLTLMTAKRALVELAKPEADRDPAAVDALVAACFGSEDYREGQAAFRERREPVFRGR